ncbi:hypothetical protein ACVQ9Z_09550 [Staphylococcus aureus]
MQNIVRYYATIMLIDIYGYGYELVLFLKNDMHVLMKNVSKLMRKLAFIKIRIKPNEHTQAIIEQHGGSRLKMVVF